MTVLVSPCLNPNIDNPRIIDSGFTFRKYALFVLSLAANRLAHQMNALAVKLFRHEKQPWWNHIISDKTTSASLYLGPLPLKKHIFGKTIRDNSLKLSQLNVQAVLTVTELFENTSRGLFTSSVTPRDWQQRNIRHLQVSTPDCKTIVLEKIHAGVEFIHENLSNGKSIYVHCKAGRGRSALITLCYLIKYKKMSAENALSLLKKQRSQIHIGSSKWATAKEYEKSLA